MYTDYECRNGVILLDNKLKSANQPSYPWIFLVYKNGPFYICPGDYDLTPGYVVQSSDGTAIIRPGSPEPEADLLQYSADIPGDSARGVVISKYGDMFVTLNLGENDNLVFRTITVAAATTFFLRRAQT